MQDSDKSFRPKLLPLIRYRDPARSIEWLCDVLGFEKQRVVTHDDGGLSYAHLSFGGNLIMVTPIGDAVPSDDFRLPNRIAGPQAQSCYFVVSDVNAHYDKAKAAGAEIVLDIKVYEHGGSRYSCRDPEGHIWNFGTYDPWQPLILTYHGRQKLDRFTVPTPKHLAIAIGGLLLLAGAGGAARLHGLPGQAEEAVDVTETARTHIDQYAHLSTQSAKIFEARKFAALQTMHDVTPLVARTPATAVDGGAEVAAEQPHHEVTARLVQEQTGGVIDEKVPGDPVHEEHGNGETPLAKGQQGLEAMR